MCPDSPSKSCSIWKATTLSPLPVTSSTATSAPSGCPTRSAPERTIAPNPAPCAARSFSSSVPAMALVLIAKRERWSTVSSGEHGDRAQLVGRDVAEAEKTDIQRDLLEQHLGADLGPAAALSRRAQQRRHLLLHHDFAD